MFYEKILAQLVAKHSGVPKTVLGLIAKKLAEKVTEENQIEGAVNDFETNSPVSIKDYADFLQSETDKRVTEAVKKAKSETKDPDPKDPPTSKKDVTDPKDIAGIIASEVAKALEPIQAKLAGNEKKSTQDELVAAAKAKGIPEKYAKRYYIGEDFDAEKAISELETEWTEIKQIAVNNSIDTTGGVVAGVKTSTKDVSEAIKTFAKTNVEASKASN